MASGFPIEKSIRLTGNFKFAQLTFSSHNQKKETQKDSVF